MSNKAKILSPVGCYDSLKAAIDAKADCIYFGVSKLNMRQLASNSFEISDLKKIATICKGNNVKSFLTVNSIIYDNEISMMHEVLDEAKKSGISAIIAHDLAVTNYARKIDLSVHISTQANISNIEAVKFYSQFSNLMVLARDLSLEQIAQIVNGIKKENVTGPSNKLVEVEIFIHGALCSAISGKCYMSLMQYNKSANRGECYQACRRKYKVTELETNKELLIDNNYIMSLKDLCTIPHLDKIINSGVKVLKIEGRARSPEYVYSVTKCYREALDSLYENTFNRKKVENWIEKLSKVYNRGFWHGGYYLGKQTDIWCSSHGSMAKEKKVYIGKATNYFSKIRVGEFLVHSDQIKIDDEIIIIGPTTGVIQTKITSLYTDKKVNIAKKGEKVAILLNKKIRKNDKLYLMVKNEP